MSYLEELKRQRQEAEAKQKAEARRHAHLQKYFQTEVAPKLRKIYLYLQEMSTHLNYLKPDTRYAYELEGMGKLENLRQGEYLVSHYDEKEHSFFLRFVCKAEKKPVFTCTSLGMQRRNQDYLWEHGIRFDYQQHNDVNQHFTSGKFTLEGEIFVDFTFSPTPAGKQPGILVVARNFEKLGKRRYVFNPEQVDKAFMDNFARYITRAHEDPLFMEHYALDPDPRLLQKQSEAEKKERRDALSEKFKDEDPAAAQARQERLARLHREAMEAELAKARTKRQEKEQTLKGFFGNLFKRK